MYGLKFTAASFAALALQVTASPAVLRRGANPAYFADPATTKYCSWWYDNDGNTDCKTVPGMFDASFADFLRWNPLVDANCNNFNPSQSYCVEAFDEPTSPPVSVPTTKPPASTTTQTGNGITTPLPTQPVMVNNCNKFYKTVKDDSCAAILKANGITINQFFAWNSGVGADCTGMWADTYYCVGVIGSTPTATPSGTTKAPATTTSAGNGITTPQPTQPGMINSCNKFYKTVKDDSCAVIAKNFGISVLQFTTWNSGVGSDCTGMWADTYFCVGILGFTPTPSATTKPPAATTTSAGNGITTPLPTQPGMVGNCNRFYKTVKDDGCAAIASKNGISTAQFISWNSGVGSDCTGMWADTNYCIGIIGFTPTPTSKPPVSTTKPGNGVTTPLPTQDGMVTNCKTFHFVKKDESCDSIIKAAGITLAQFSKWNPAVGSTCTGMWAETYCCIAIL
ncbi:carbohydrate-binding module family 50 protein [Melanomma pulvis-pyrius CBS 109.77]|uniref:Carbohydrate-binding module family 50 protein n=1 Tax=Melanomma pulvis-pyrius CBS 109.77 TaxID=1314802 RepID=A0A6A6XGR0_9PLEO|nr:carbohydrate-binding module family 50 protein [Melanomma pulvis-pyrius CBS 109.77]